MTWKCKVFKWCGGVGADINLDDLEYCRSRILLEDDGTTGYSSCSIVGYIRNGDDNRRDPEGHFIEMMPDEILYGHSRKVYIVVLVIQDFVNELDCIKAIPMGD